MMGRPIDLQKNPVIIKLLQIYINFSGFYVN